MFSTWLAALLAWVLATGVATANPITVENANAGFSGWMYPLANTGSEAAQYAGTVTTIDGYTSASSVLPGGTVQLHVSSQGGRPYRVEVFRMGWYGGAGARRMLCLPSCSTAKAGVQQPAPTPLDANGLTRADWPVTDTVPVGLDWTSGYYIAQLVLTSGSDAGRARWVPFVVLPPPGGNAQVLVQVPVNTWAAYNGWGGKSLYDNKSVDGIRANRVSFDRPYWSSMFDMFDHELGTVRFLEREGYDVAYVTDIDVHRTPSLLTGRRLVISNGHDEYWTGVQRDAFEAARGNGVNLAFLGANMAYWQVRYADAEHTVIGYKSTSDPIADPAQKTVLFRDVGRPECELLGVQYDNTWKLDGVVRSYQVAAGATAHPWMSGTGFTAGEALSATNTVGYEWDLVTPGCATPPITRLFTWDGTSQGLLGADAVTYTAPSGARVFSAGSLDFVLALDGWRAYGSALGTANPKLQTLMRNMFNDMTATDPGPVNQAPLASMTSSASEVDPGQPVTFTDTSTDADGSIAARAWDTDNNGVFDNGTGTTVQVAFATPGTYTVRLRVTDDRGATATASRQVSVNGTVQPLSNLLSNGSFETTLNPWGGYQATAVREAQAGAPEGGWVAKVTYSSGTSFTLDDGNRQLTSVVAAHNYAASAWVRAATTAAVGRSVTLKLRERTPAGAQVADVSGSPVVLTTAWQRVTVSRTAAATGNSMGVRASFSPAVTGTAFFMDDVWVTDQSSAPAPNQSPTAAFTVSPAVPVAGRAVTFTDISTDPDGSIAARAWDTDNDGAFDDGTGGTATATFASAGTYTVRLQVTDNRGGSAVATRQVTVDVAPPNQPPVAAFTVTPLAPVVGRSVTFTDASTDADGTIATRAWDTNDDGVFDNGSGATASTTFASAGTFPVRLRVTDDAGATDVAAVLVTVAAAPPNQAPTASFTVSPSAPLAGQAVTFTDTSTDADGSIAARAWDTDNNGVFDNGTGMTASTTFASPGTFTVRLRVTDDAGATAVATVQLTVGAAASNLIANWSFEATLTPWSAYQGTLTREAQAGAPDGGFVARATRSTGTSFTIDDGGRHITNLAAGAAFTATAWVKAGSASSVGKPVVLRLRERTASGTQVADVSGPTVTLTDAWQQVTVSRTVTTAGGNLGVRASQGSAVTGNAFVMDAVRVVRTN